jgi:hypothetical protein
LGCPPGVDIGEIKVDEEQKKITIDADLKEPLDSNATLTARIPRALLDNITNVAAESKQGPNVMEFSVNELGPDDTTIGINIGSRAQNAGTIELVISQTQTGP